MLRSLVVKELREAAGLVVLAALAMVLVIAWLVGEQLTPWGRGQASLYPFVQDNEWYVALWLIGGGLGGLLGLKQTAWELSQGTFYFLLHRPARRRLVFSTKLVVGGGLLLTATGIAILVYAMWAATPGHHPSPFFWSMTGQAWQIWFATPLIYLGAFVSGMRPGKWYGSRFLPLVTGVSLAFVLAYTTAWWLGLAIGLVAMAVYVSTIFYYVESRDY